MKKLIVCFLLVFLAVVGCVDAFAKGGSPLNAYWKDGLHFDSEDESFKLKVGGRIYMDAAFMVGDDALDDAIGEIEDKTEIRSSRLHVSGTIYGRVKFKGQYEYSGGKATPKSVYMALTKVPVLGRIKVGHYKEPFSLEALTSSRFITFMERGPVYGFAPRYNMGVEFKNHVLDDRVTWAAGAFRNTDKFGKSVGKTSGYNYTCRLTGLPFYEDKGERLVHLGVSYSYQTPPDDTANFHRKTEVHTSPNFVDTGDIIGVDSINMIDGELAMVFGPLSFQGEYVHSMLETASGGDPDFSAFYISASFFLTGEHRRYKKSKGAFSRIKPKNNVLGPENGLGAWEVAVRYANIDLDDSGIQGGILDDITAGLNWYLNPNTRVMFNYVFSELDNVGEAHAFQTRFQVDF